MEDSTRILARFVLEITESTSATEATYTDAASSSLGRTSEQAVHCECLHTIAVADFTKLFDTIKMWARLNPRRCYQLM